MVLAFTCVALSILRLAVPGETPPHQEKTALGWVQSPVHGVRCDRLSHRMSYMLRFSLPYRTVATLLYLFFAHPAGRRVIGMSPPDKMLRADVSAIGECGKMSRNDQSSEWRPRRVLRCQHPESHDSSWQCRYY
jgi:hypothetical protein